MRHQPTFNKFMLAIGILGFVGASGLVACKKKSSKQAVAAPAPSPSATPAPVTPSTPATPQTPPPSTVQPPATGTLTGLTCISSGLFGRGAKTVVIDEIGLKMSIAENGSNAENYTLTKVSSNILYPASPRYEAIPQSTTNNGAAVQKGTVIVNTHDFGTKKGKKQLIMSGVPYSTATGVSSIVALIECP